MLRVLRRGYHRRELADVGCQALSASLAKNSFGSPETLITCHPGPSVGEGPPENISDLNAVVGLFHQES